MKTERLDKILARHGFGTRKDVKKFLRTGIVTVNGVVVRTPETHINLETDTLVVDNETISLKEHVYLMMNKRANVVCSAKDGARSTVFDFLDDDMKHTFLGGDLHLVGRLDVDTTGLLLLTTDGELTHRLTSPKTHMSKTYEVVLRDSVSETSVQDDYKKEFAAGLAVPAEANEAEFVAQPAELTWKTDNTCTLVIYEGKYHQVKRMFAVMGNEVVGLHRSAIGKLVLDLSLELGEYRELTEEEFEFLS